MTLASKIESILFFKSEPISLKKLAALLNVKDDELSLALSDLRNNLLNRGVVLIEKHDEVMLGTSPEASALIEQLSKEEISKDLGKAGLETLSIVLYRGPITRSGIDHIRGVNSTFILRNLMIRGLVEKIQNPNDQRSFLYRHTFELLSYLGIERVHDLPEFGQVVASIDEFNKENNPLNDHDGGSETNESAQ